MILKYLLSKERKKLIVRLKMIKWQIKNARRKVTLYPSVIQLPITYLCNFDCVMCGMHNMIDKKDFSVNDLKQILSDPLFSRVHSVGINGGEPFLKNDLVECIQVMAEILPRLEQFNIISNGFFTDKILDALSQIKSICSEYHVHLNVSFSVDGINDMQDYHRGHKDAFFRVNQTIQAILADKNRYTDSLLIICTITRYNIERINEVEVWAKETGVEVSYNIATVNVRIGNEDRLSDFSVFSDEHMRMLAEEFFHKKYLESLNERYFAIYLYLKTGKRYDTCPCMYNEWITLTPDTQLGFCATHSKNLGSGLEQSAYEIIKKNIPYLQEIKSKYCSTCSHYIEGLNMEGLNLLGRDWMKNFYMR